MTLPSALAGQDTLIPDTTACPRCRILATPLVAFGDTLADAEGLIPDYVSSEQVDTRGRWFIAARQRLLPLVYDESGRFVGELGRHGGGPGEYRYPAALAVWQDSIHVLNVLNQRVSVFGPRLDYVGGIPMTFIGAAASAGGAWVGWISRYRIERYGSNGDLRQTIRRDAAWFAPWARQPASSMDRPPVPIGAGVWEDADGLLWTLTLVPGRDWKAGLGETIVEPGGERANRVINPNLYLPPAWK